MQATNLWLIQNVKQKKILRCMFDHYSKSDLAVWIKDIWLTYSSIKYNVPSMTDHFKILYCNLYRSLHKIRSTWIYRGNLTLKNIIVFCWSFFTIFFLVIKSGMFSNLHQYLRKYVNCGRKKLCWWSSIYSFPSWKQLQSRYICGYRCTEIAVGSCFPLFFGRLKEAQESIWIQYE